MIDKIPEISELAEGSNKVKTIGELVGDDKAGEQYAALKAAYTLIEDTGGVLLDNLTVEELQVKLQETRADLANQYKILELEALRIQKERVGELENAVDFEKSKYKGKTQTRRFTS